MTKTYRQGNVEYSLDGAPDYGTSDAGYMRYHPKPFPEPPDEDLVMDFDDPRLSAEVAAEMMRRFKAMPKGSEERKRGIVEYTDPETGQLARYDRYGKLAKEGFEPARDKGHVDNFFRYMNTKQAEKTANLKARDREYGVRQKDYQVRAKAHQQNEASRAGSINDYNQWLEREESREYKESQAAALAAHRRETLDLDREKMNTPRPMTPAYEDYLGAQTERWEAEAEYARGGKSAGHQTGRPSGALTQNQNLDRMKDLETSIDEYRAALEGIDNVGDRWMFGLLGSPDGKPSSMESPVFGDEDVTINSKNRDQYRNRYERLRGRATNELSDLEAQYNEYYGPSRGSGQSGGTPPQPPGAAGPPPGAAIDGAEGDGMEAMKAQSWVEKPDPLQMPGAGELQQLPPEEQMWFAELQRLEQEGFNVDSPTVQNHAAEIVQARMAGDRDAGPDPSYRDTRWPSGSR